MKIIPPLLLGSFLFLAMASQQEAMAGSCTSRTCNVTYVAPPVQRTSAIAATSHSFTAIGGSRVANINLSQEARDGLNAGGKEEPLPKGFLTAAERAKLIAKQQPLYGWPEDEILGPSPRVQSRSSITTRVSRHSRGTVLRTQAKSVKRATAVKVAVVTKTKE